MSLEGNKNNYNLKRYISSDVLIQLPIVIHEAISKGILRNDNVILPMSSELQDFYYNNTGNINSGFAIPVIISMTLRASLSVLNIKKNHPIKNWINF